MIKRFLSLFCFLIFSISASATPYTVKYGDSLYSLLSNTFTPVEIIGIDKSIKKVIPGFTLKTGKKIHFAEDSITLKLDITKELKIIKTDESFDIKLKEFPITRVISIVSGSIDSALFSAMTKIGEREELAFEIANILEWEIDFFKDIRKGDHFDIIVEKKFCRDKFIGYGRIYAIDFTNKGRLVRGLYYETDKTRGYYTPEGKSLRKGFLKAPLKFARISSRFQHRRLHPVLKKYRPHYGVDYAAPTGTPVVATADGRITKRGYRKGNGNYVKLKHNNGYETIYMHFSRFKRGQRVGTYVKQGDIIGYVGSTGYSTGPHVDYRIKKHGSYLNPLRFSSPTKTLPKKHIAAFEKETRKYKDMLCANQNLFAFNQY